MIEITRKQAEAIVHELEGYKGFLESDRCCYLDGDAEDAMEYLKIRLEVERENEGFEQRVQKIIDKSNETMADRIRKIYGD